MGTPLRRVKVPMDGILSLQHTSCTPQFGVIWKSAQSATQSHCPCHNEITDQYNPLRDNTHYCLHLYTEPLTNSVHEATKPIPYPANSPSIKPICLQFSTKNIVGDSIKGLTEGLDDTVALPLSTDAVTPSWKATRLVGHNLAFVIQEDLFHALKAK